jgi:hypothetical protein
MAGLVPAIFLIAALRRTVATIGNLKHDPEKCAAVFRKDHAPSKS